MSSPLIADTEMMVSLTGIARAALKDVRLTCRTLLMPVDDDSVQGRLTSRASLLVCIGWVQVVVHISHGMRSLSLKTGSPDPMLLKVSASSSQTATA